MSIASQPEASIGDMSKPYYATGDISRMLCEPKHRVEFVIKSRGIVPSFRAGNARVFDRQHLDLIADAIREIDRRKGR